MSDDLSLLIASLILCYHQFFSILFYSVICMFGRSLFFIRRFLPFLFGQTLVPAAVVRTTLHIRRSPKLPLVSRLPCLAARYSTRCDLDNSFFLFLCLKLRAFVLYCTSRSALRNRRNNLFGRILSKF